MFKDKKDILRLIALIIIPVAFLMGTKMFLIVFPIGVFSLATVFLIFPESYNKFLDILNLSDNKKVFLSINKISKIISLYIFAGLLFFQGISMSWAEDLKLGIKGTLIVALLTLIFLILDKYIISVQDDDIKPMIIIICYAFIALLVVAGGIVYLLHGNNPPKPGW